MATVVFGIVGAVVGVAGMVISFITILRNKKSDDKSEGKEDGIVLTELGYIKKGIEGIEQRLETQENRYVTVVRDIAEVTSSVKQAHHRIDRLEKYHQP